jgi:glycosyltransferase involved in cell wall biosynthesis
VIRALYLSYDGMTDPLGQAQVIPYLRGLARAGRYSIDIVSCEKPALMLARGGAIRRQLEDAGIGWHHLPYTRRPAVGSTVFDLLRMRTLAADLQRARRYDLVHARSYPASLVALSLKRRFGSAFLFDMRGFWPDEKLDDGSWSLDHPVYRQVYRYFKRAEARFIAEADAIVVLSRAARTVVERHPALHADTPLRVIPCSVDFSEFAIQEADRDISRQALGVRPQDYVLAYLGSVAAPYPVADMFAFFAALKEQRSDSRFLFITHSPADPILAAAREQNIASDDIIVRSGERAEVPSLLAAADAALLLRRVNASSVGCFPTKLGEYMAAGLPVVARAGISDVDEMVRDTAGGVLLQDLTVETCRHAVVKLLAFTPADREALRAKARGVCDLAGATSLYGALYDGIAARRTSSAFAAVSEPRHNAAEA